MGEMTGAMRLIRETISLQELQRVQICQKIIHLLRRQNISEAIHLIPAKHDDVSYPVVIRRQAAGAQVLLSENALQARALASAR